MLIVCLFILIKTYYIQWNKNKNIFSCHLFFSTECHGKSGLLGDAARNHSGPAVDHRCRIRNSLCTLRYESTQFLFHALMAPRRTSFKYQSIKIDFYGESSFFFIIFRSETGYRCLRAIGFLSGMAAGAGCMFWLQLQEITLVNSQADSGTCTTQTLTPFHFHKLAILITSLFLSVSVAL